MKTGKKGLKKTCFQSMFVSFASDNLQPKADQPPTAQATEQSQCFIQTELQ
jgi:hypothetical protein